MVPNDAFASARYGATMPRKSDKQVRNDWYLADWMATLRVSQADIARLTGWSKATVNDIYHGRTAYYRDIVNTLAQVLKVAPFELLMHPDDAMTIRQYRATALQLVADPRRTFSAAPPDMAPAEPRKAS